MSKKEEQKYMEDLVNLLADATFKNVPVANQKLIDMEDEHFKMLGILAVLNILSDITTRQMLMISRVMREFDVKIKGTPTASLTYLTNLSKTADKCKKELLKRVITEGPLQ